MNPANHHKNGIAMKSLPRIAAVAAIVSAMAGVSPAVRADEVSELKAAVQALQQRIEELESRAKAVDETNDRQTDQIAVTRSNVGGWVSNFTWKGDLRYRNETIDQQYLTQRNRDRIRARAGFVAKVNDTIRTEFQLATTELNDPRSSNVTLSGENSRKSINLDLAYAEWQPHADWRFTAGKMRQTWIRPGQSVLFDGDINPEGLAANFGHGDFFASAFYNSIEERSASADSSMVGGQFGWRPTFGAARVTLGASYFDMRNVQGRNPFYAGSNGNTTTSVAANCQSATPCLVNDYDQVEAFAEWSMPVAGRPLALYADYFNNIAADNDLDTAYSTGVMYGRANDPRTWEIGYFYQLIEKDSLFGQFIDSDFGGGNTDSRGSVIKLAFAPAKNWVINTWYHFGETNLDSPAAITGVGPVYDRDYRRLQVDLNFKY